MNRYTIYCTEEQTKKALELGAPIEMSPYFPQVKYEVFNAFVLGVNMYHYPTAEQMRRWLQEQGFMFGIYERPKIGHLFYVYYKDWDTLVEEDDCFATDEEATLAAIDSALDYLIKNK